MHDVIVIGAGGGGPVVAKELAGRGLRVLLLEGGARFAKTEKDWTHFEGDAINPISGYLRVGPEDRTRPAWYRDTPQNSLIIQAAAVGGTTTIYFGNSPRAMPGVFNDYQGSDRRRYDWRHRFPFGYSELLPYYEWVESTLPVQTAPMGTKDEIFLEAGLSVGLPVQTTKDISQDAIRPQQNAILQPEGTAGLTTNADALRFPHARGCTFCGSCTLGCYEPIGAPRNLKAKRSTDNSYVPMALTADRWSSSGRAVTLVANAYVTRIHTDQGLFKPRATGVSWRDTHTGEVYREDAKVVVLSGGCVESPRLWLNSDLPNPNGWVGKGLTNHGFDLIVGLMPFETASSKGPGSASRADFPGRGSLEPATFGPAFQASVLSMSEQGIRGVYGLGSTGAWDGRSGRTLGAELLEFQRNLDRLINILVLTDDDVEEANNVTRSPAFVDEHGRAPRVTMIRNRFRTRRTVRNREWLTNKAAEILRAAGAEKVIRVDCPPVILHVQSTMRMGVSRRNSVLETTAEARFVRRLFVADNSALANAIGGPNPTLTNQALATRTAEKIFQKYFGGSRWVRTESPVPSTDDRVTRGLIDLGLA